MVRIKVEDGTLLALERKLPCGNATQFLVRLVAASCRVFTSFLCLIFSDCVFLFLCAVLYHFMFATRPQCLSVLLLKRSERGLFGTIPFGF